MFEGDKDLVSGEVCVLEAWSCFRDEEGGYLVYQDGSIDLRVVAKPGDVEVQLGIGFEPGAIACGNAVVADVVVTPLFTDEEARRKVSDMAAAPIDGGAMEKEPSTSKH